MELNKDSWSDITIEDLVKTGVLDVDYNKDTLEGCKKILNEVNKKIKNYFVTKNVKRAKKNLNKIDEDFNLTTTDWFKTDIAGKLTIIGDRTVTPEPRPTEDKYKDWFFRGICTLKDFTKSFRMCYETFKNNPSYLEFYDKKLETYEWELEVYVIGAIIGGQRVIDEDIINHWRDKGVRIEQFGFNKSGCLTNETEMLVEAMSQFREEVKDIKKKGSPDDLREARLLKLDREEDKMFMELFGQSNPFK